MKKHYVYFFVYSSFLVSVTSTQTAAQNTSPYWSLAGNSTATAASKLGTTNAIPLRLFTNNLERVRVDATTGRVGIGTTNPVSPLTIKATGGTPVSSWVVGLPLIVGFSQAINNEFDLATASNSAGQRPVFLCRRSRGTLAAPTAVQNNDFLTSFVTSGYDGSAFQNPAAIDFYVDGTPSAGNVPARISLVTGSNSSNRLERLKVGSTGNFNFNNNQLYIEQATGKIGVGTTLPNAKLAVFSPDNPIGINVSNTYTGDQDIYGIKAYAAATSRRGTGGSFTGGYNGGSFTGGRIGIDVTADAQTSPVTGVVTQAYNFACFYDLDATNIGVDVYAAGGSENYGIVAGAGEPEGHCDFQFNAAGYFNGDVYANNYFLTSDRKFKTDIKPLQNSLNQLMQLKPSSFTFKKSDNLKTMGLPAGKQLGLIADEVKQVFPELVKEAVTPAKYSKDGTKIREQVKYGAVNYVGIIPVLVASIQEQQKQNEGLQKRNEDLQMQINELRELVNSLLKDNANTTISSSAILKQNRPNPTNGSTTINYSIPNNLSNGQLAITDMKGRVVRTYTAPKGEGSIEIMRGDLPAGTYNYTLIVNGKKEVSRQMVIVR